MFSYRGSKLEDDIKELNININKTEYEKSIEPFKTQIKKLQKELYEMKEDMEALYHASNCLINNIEKDYITFLINEEVPKAYFSANYLSKTVKLRRVNIPIKQNAKEEFMQIFYDYKNKYKFEILEDKEV